MIFQDTSMHGSKLQQAENSVIHGRTNGQAKSNLPHQRFQCWGHNYNQISTLSISLLPVAMLDHDKNYISTGSSLANTAGYSAACSSGLPAETLPGKRLILCNVNEPHHEKT